jgi:hypothetical protein
MPINEESLKLNLGQKYMQLYAEVRKQGYPLEHGFLITKIKFQDYVISLMKSNITIAIMICNAYLELKNDKTLQERALIKYEENAKYESYLDGVDRS